MAEPRERNFKVSATGGAGTNGQPARYAAGIDNAQDFYDVQTAAPMAGRNPANRPPAVAQEQRPAPRMPLDGLVPLDAPTQYPDEGVDTGGALGPNAGEEVMAAPAMLRAQNSQDVAALASYLPFYAKIAEMPQASNAFRNWYRYVRSQVEGGA
jgi:hypothetical protein